MPYATVAKTRQKVPVQLYYEVHGAGPVKLLFIMGLNVAMQSWYDYFGSLPPYTAAAFDNRGVGMSDAPVGRYTTSEMAKDAYDLLMWLGWKSNVHVVGIAQELSLLAPELIGSLTIISSHAGFTLPPTSAIYNIPKLLMIRDMQSKLTSMRDLLFPPVRMARRKVHEKPGPHNGEAILKVMSARGTKTRVQQPLARWLAAAMTHYVSPARLKKIVEYKIPVIVATGTWDNLIHPSNSEYMAKILQTRSLFDGLEKVRLDTNGSRSTL
ncbi:Alpha/Beta hydrolase protein [Chytridium lagenaria]|nr:Alpha/Beta hydrolase protein [Chytridium lagenaria]